MQTATNLNRPMVAPTGHKTEPLPYTRARYAQRIAGTLPTQDTILLCRLALSAKLSRIQNSSLNFRMRLAAMAAADTRNGQVW